MSDLKPADIQELMRFIRKKTKPDKKEFHHFALRKC